jgi:hypothetical protein
MDFFRGIIGLPSYISLVCCSLFALFFLFFFFTSEGFGLVPPLLLYLFPFFNKILEFGGIGRRFPGVPT